MRDYLTIIVVLATFIVITIKPARKIEILGSGVFITILLNQPEMEIQKVWNYINLPILALIVSLGIFSIIGTKTKLLNLLGSKIVSRFGKSKNSHIIIQLFLLGITYGASLFMNNLAAILIIVPISLKVAVLLGIANIERLIIFEVIVSNLGGASILIGDFPNMIISSCANVSFIEFLVNLGLFIFFVLLPLTLGIYFYIIKRDILKEEIDSLKELKKAMGIELITKFSECDMKNSLITGMLFSGMIIVFIIYKNLTLASIAFIAASFALILMFLTGYHEDILEEVDIKTISVFPCLFILAGIVGSLDLVSILKSTITSLPQLVSVLTLMWTVAIFTAVLSAGPTTACFLPIAEAINGIVPANLAWWALSLGVLAGSSATVLGATAGPIAAGIYERYTHRKFSFVEFIKIGFPIMFAYLILSSIYIIIRYLNTS